ncbi:MAG: UbiH/UbiF/VisC/COQ6 family ubiquinone biosynthesis hydroxylase [Pseudomonadota bacterium]|nr:UbiH/UbiF/VisC/COQ6 family ubiquinone biosynthesis hydroxylase [Pseudomonadota bacterium]
MSTAGNTAVDCDVAVVGAGLVGAAAALGLHRLGLRVRLLERKAPPLSLEDYDSRVYAVSPASVRLLESLGLWRGIESERVSPYTAMRVWEDDIDQGLHFDAADARTDLLGYIVENRVMQQRLWNALPAGVLREGVNVRSCVSNETSATLEFDGGGSLRAMLVIAADSAHSPLRVARGIDVMRHAYDQTAVVCHVQTERPHRGVAYQRFVETGPLAFLPLADGRSSIVWSTTEAEALLQLDDMSFCAALTAVSQQVLGRIESTTPRLTFPLTLQHAETYVQPRFALMGDAAHVIHPLAGQGMNLGFGDVAAMLDTLEQAQRAGRDPGALRVLEKYQRTRRAAASEMIAVTDGLYRLYRAQQPAARWLRQRGVSAVNAAAPLRQALVRAACGL